MIVDENRGVDDIGNLADGRFQRLFGVVRREHDRDALAVNHRVKFIIPWGVAPTKSSARGLQSSVRFHSTPRVLTGAGDWSNRGCGCTSKVLFRADGGRSRRVC